MERERRSRARTFTILRAPSTQDNHPVSSGTWTRREHGRAAALRRRTRRAQQDRGARGKNRPARPGRTQTRARGRPQPPACTPILATPTPAPLRRPSPPQAPSDTHATDSGVWRRGSFFPLRGRNADGANAHLHEPCVATPARPRPARSGRPVAPPGEPRTRPPRITHWARRAARAWPTRTVDERATFRGLRRAARRPLEGPLPARPRSGAAGSTRKPLARALSFASRRNHGGRGQRQPDQQQHRQAGASARARRPRARLRAEGAPDEPSEARDGDRGSSTNLRTGSDRSQRRRGPLARWIQRLNFVSPTSRPLVLVLSARVPQLMQFSKNSIALVQACNKPDTKGASRGARGAVWAASQRADAS